VDGYESAMLILHRDETSLVGSIAPKQAHASDDVLRVQPVRVESTRSVASGERRRGEQLAGADYIGSRSPPPELRSSGPSIFATRSNCRLVAGITQRTGWPATRSATRAGRPRSTNLRNSESCTSEIDAPRRMNRAASRSLVPKSPNAHTDESPLTRTVVERVTSAPAVGIPPRRRTRRCNLARGSHALPVKAMCSPRTLVSHFFITLVPICLAHVSSGE
jgi:hypothetical protein